MNIRTRAQRLRTATVIGMEILILLGVGSPGTNGAARAEDTHVESIAASASRPAFTYLFTPGGRHRVSVDGRYGRDDCDDSPIALSGDLCAERSQAGVEVKGRFWQQTVGIDSTMEWRPAASGLASEDMRAKRAASEKSGFVPRQHHSLSAALPSVAGWRLRSHADFDDAPTDTTGGSWRRDLTVGAEAHGPIGRIGAQSRRTAFRGDPGERAALDHRLTWRGELPIGLAERPLVPDWVGLQFDHVTFTRGEEDALELRAWQPAGDDAQAVEVQSAMQIGWKARRGATRLELRQVARGERGGGGTDTQSMALRRVYDAPNYRVTSGVRVSRPSQGELGYRGEIEAGLGQRRSLADRVTGKVAFDHTGGVIPVNRAEIELRGSLTGISTTALDGLGDQRPFVEVGLGLGLSDRGTGLNQGLALQDVSGRLRGGWKF